MNSVSFNNVTLATDSATRIVRVTGFNSVVSISNFLISNSDLFSEQAIYLEGSYRQVAILGLTAENLTIDTDGSIFSIEVASVLQASQFNFNNIQSYSSDSTNNFMIDIISVDISAAFPSTLQNLTASNFTTGVLKVQTLTGNLTQNNMFLIQDLDIFNIDVTNSIDLITFTSLITYERYSIIISGVTFHDLNFLQGSNLFNFQHLINAPVQIVNGSFYDITGGKINVQSSTSSFSDLSTNLIMSNITVDNVNAKFDSFINLQTGAVLSISESNLALTLLTVMLFIIKFVLRSEILDVDD